MSVRNTTRTMFLRYRYVVLFIAVVLLYALGFGLYEVTAP